LPPPPFFTISFTATETNPSVAILYINGAANETIDPYVSGANNFSSIHLDDGYYNWTVWINDSATNNAWYSVNYSLTVDTVNPLINYEAGTQNDSAYYSQDWIYVNVSFTETNFKNITFYLNETDEVSYLTLTTNYNWTGLSDGNFSINVTICDITAKCDSASTRSNISLDTTYPEISYASGTEADGVYRNQDWIFVNVS